MSAEAWAAAGELAERAGVNPTSFIEFMLLDLRDHHAGASTRPEPAPVDQQG